MTDLLAHVEHNIRSRRLLARGQSVLVAVSGGLDSMVLLHLLHALAFKRRWKLRVAHFNHQLRGRSSDADERIVRRTAAALGLPHYSGRAAVKAVARKRGESLEMAARQLRHEFLAQTARRGGCPAIAIAHHADDQVELFFLRLLRGAGGEGIAGMKWHSPSPADSALKLVRPLLDLSRMELNQFARENRIRFREDASNASPDILRNRIRHELLPFLRRRFQPALDKSVLRLMEIVGAESKVVGEAASDWLKSKRRSLSRLPVGLQRRIIQLQLLQHGIAPDFELIETLRTAPDTPATVAPGKFAVSNAAGRVALRNVTSSEFNEHVRLLQLNNRAGGLNFDGALIRWRFTRQRGAVRPAPLSGLELLDANQVGKRIVLRHWRAGDRYQPIGMSGSAKLQDCFTNQRIPPARRHELIVATTATGEIFWVEGLRISEKFKLTPATQRRLIWRWQRC